MPTMLISLPTARLRAYIPTLSIAVFVLAVSLSRIAHFGVAVLGSHWN